MTLLEIPSLEEGTSKEEEGWRMAVVAVVVVEAAVQILAACMFVQGRKAAGWSWLHNQECTKAQTVSAAHPPNSQTRGNVAEANSR